jgi:hypothetical protein
MQLAAIRWLFKLGGLALLLPIAALLKAIGIPVLAVLSIVAIPVIILLFLFGLPIFLVLIAGGAIVGVIGFAMMGLLIAAKIFIFVVLPIMLIVKLVKWIFGRRRGDDSPPTVSTDTPDTPPPVDPIVDPLD